VLTGFKPIVIAIVVEAVIKIGGKALKHWVHFVIAGLAFVSIYFLHIPFPLIVLAAAVIGLLGAHFIPSIFVAQTKSETDNKKRSQNK
jgi:chromate transporter